MYAALVLAVFLAGPELHSQEALHGVFIENRGQWDTPMAYVARSGDLCVGVDGSGLWLWRSGVDEAGVITRDALRLSFEDLEEPTSVRGLGPAPGLHNYFLGNDPAQWQRHVRRYQGVEIDGAALSVSVRLNAAHSGLDLTFRPASGHTGPVSLVVAGEAEAWQVDAAGFVLHGSGSTLELREHSRGSPSPPPAEAAGRWRAEANAGGRVRIEIPAAHAQDGKGAIHAGLEWSTLLGGLEGGNAVSDLVVAENGDVVVVGDTSSFDFPITHGAYQWSLTPTPFTDFPIDAYVARLSDDGTRLVAATFVGGNQNEDPRSALISADGSVLVGRRTSSSNFPVTPGAWNTTLAGVDSGFVLKLSPQCDELLFSTAVGGSDDDGVGSLTLLEDGRLLLTGYTRSPDFPVTPGSFDTTFDADQGIDYFMVRLLPDGSDIDYATFFSDLGGPGGSGATTVLKSFVEDDGRLLVVGWTSSIEFFATTTVGAAPSGVADLFVTRFDEAFVVPEESILISATGGVGVVGAARNAMGETVVIGFTGSTDYPTTPHAFMPNNGGGHDAVVTCIDSSLSGLQFSTYLGAHSDDRPWRVAIDDSGVVTVAGMTFSDFFPTTQGALQEESPGSMDAWVARLDPTGRRLLYSTILGSPAGEAYLNRMGLVLDPSGSAFVAGGTGSGMGFPTTPGAFMEEGDSVGLLAFITKLTMLPVGVARFGSPSPGCGSPLVIGVGAGPFVGTGDFALTCTGAPQLSGEGVLAVSAQPLDASQSVAGIEAWVDLESAVFLRARSQSTGFGMVAVPVPDDAALAGISVAAQFFWPEACGPEGWIASNALAITVQP